MSFIQHFFLVVLTCFFLPSRSLTAFKKWGNWNYGFCTFFRTLHVRLYTKCADRCVCAVRGAYGNAVLKGEGALMLMKMFPNTWWLMAGVGSQGLTASLSRCMAQAQGYVCYNLSLCTHQQGLTRLKQSHLDIILSLVQFIWIVLSWVVLPFGLVTGWELLRPERTRCWIHTFEFYRVCCVLDLYLIVYNFIYRRHRYALGFSEVQLFVFSNTFM